MANQLLDAFTDTKRVTKSYILAVNAPTRLKSQKDNLRMKSLMSLKYA